MDPTYLAASVVILIFSIIIHEVMHGLVALKFGDHTAESAGRLTLNPIPHIDPVGSILLPALLIVSGSGFIIGWAKPVPVNPLHFRNIKSGEIWVSLAGILSNLALATVAVTLFHLLLPSLGINNTLTNIFRFTFTINLVLAIFNLIPVPPLDGSKVLMALLPYNLARQYDRLSPYGTIIILALWMLPIFGVPLLNLIVGGSVFLVSSTLGIPPKLF